MSKSVNRLSRDRLLFESDLRRQLSETIAYSNPQIVAGVVAKMLELQVVAEEFAASQGILIEDHQLASFRNEHQKELEEQINRAITAFIGAIVSQEG